MRAILAAFTASFLAALPASAATPLGSLSPAGQLSDTDTLPVCQTAGGCGSTSALLSLPMWQLQRWASAPNWATTPVSGAAIASPGGSGTNCTVASPCSLTQAVTNAGANGYVYLRGNAGPYYVAPSTSDPCALGFNGPPAINITSGDAGQTWATYPGDSQAVIDGSQSGAAEVMGYSSSATLSGTTLTLGGTIRGTWQAGQTVYGFGAAGGVVIQSGSGTAWTVLNPNGLSGSARQSIGLNGAMTGIQVLTSSTAAAPEFYGIKLQNFGYGAIVTCSSRMIVSNDEFTNDGNVLEYSNDTAAIALLTDSGSVVTNNYLHDLPDEGVTIQSSTTSGGDAVDNNFMLNVCSQLSAGLSYADCGGIQFEGDGSTTTGGQTYTFSRNYIRDVYKNGNGLNADGGYCIYIDGYSWNVSESQNVCTGYHGYCFLINASQNIHVLNNICDLTGGGSTATVPVRIQNGGGSSNPMTGNVIEGNIFVGNYNGASGAGWQTDSSLPALPTTQDNLYYNYYSGGTVANTCTGQCGAGSVLDQYPIYGNPLLRCYGAILSQASPANTFPVSFPAQPAGWDAPGYWGAVGMTMPETGTAPIWPTTSGDGVACTSGN